MGGKREESEGAGGGTPARRCPICGREAVAEWRPFCSKRCADIDLGRWLGGRYVIPGEPGAVSPGGDAEEEEPG